MDGSIGYSTSGTAAWDEPMTRAFVMSIGSSSSNAEDEWDDNKIGFCGSLWSHWMSPAMDGTCGGVGPDIPDLPDLIDFSDGPDVP